MLPGVTRWRLTGSGTRGPGVARRSGTRASSLRRPAVQRPRWARRRTTPRGSGAARRRHHSTIMRAPIMCGRRAAAPRCSCAICRLGRRRLSRAAAQALALVNGWTASHSSATVTARALRRGRIRCMPRRARSGLLVQRRSGAASAAGAAGRRARGCGPARACGAEHGLRGGGRGLARAQRPEGAAAGELELVAHGRRGLLHVGLQEDQACQALCLVICASVPVMTTANTMAFRTRSRMHTKIL